MEYLGSAIKKKRKERGLSQLQIAEILGMSRSTISLLESGKIQDIGIRKILRILDVLELELRVRDAGSPPTLDELLRDGDQGAKRKDIGRIDR